MLGLGFCQKKQQIHCCCRWKFDSVTRGWDLVEMWLSVTQTQHLSLLWLDCFFNGFFSCIAGALHPVRDVLGAHEPEGAHLLQHRADGEGQQLLQDVHHLDQREDSKDVRREEHVRVQAHQGAGETIWDLLFCIFCNF